MDGLDTFTGGGPIERLLDQLAPARWLLEPFRWFWLAFMWTVDLFVELHCVGATQAQREARFASAVADARATRGIDTNSLQRAMTQAIRRSLALSWGRPEDSFHVAVIVQINGWTAIEVIEAMEYAHDPLKTLFQASLSGQIARPAN